MGLTIPKLFDNLFGKKEKRILMLGLESAGKTSILNKLKLIEAISALICVGFHMETGIHEKVTFISWDIGDQT